MEELKATSAKLDHMNLTLDEISTKDGLVVGVKTHSFPSKLSLDGLQRITRIESTTSANNLSNLCKPEVSTCTDAFLY